MLTVTSSQYPQKLKLMLPTTYSYSNTISPVHSERALVELLSFLMIFFKRQREREHFRQPNYAENLCITDLTAKFNLVLLILGSEFRERQPKRQIAYFC